MEPKRVGFLGFERCMALDLIGPMEAFAAARVEGAKGAFSRGYEVMLVGAPEKSFTSESGVEFRARWSIGNAPPLDTLVIAGGCGLRDAKVNRKVAEWVRGRSGKIRRIASVCTGVYGLAPTGLLDGRRVTTHWQFTEDLAQRFPKLKVVPNALFIKDGPIYTSAGVTAGIDLSLSLIEEDYGPTVALAVARELVVYLKRPGGQEQYSEPLQFQTRASDPFSDLAAWMVGHLDQKLSVEVLADRVRLCPRHFTRRFTDVFSRPPGAFVEDLRMNESRRRLLALDKSIESVSRSIGFTSADSFRRAFERRFGVSPSAYRRNFELSGRERRRKRARVAGGRAKRRAGQQR